MKLVAASPLRVDTGRVTNSRPHLTPLDQSGNELDDLIERMRAFVTSAWAERAREYGRDEPQDLTGACIVSTAFAQQVLGGEVRGSWHHLYLVLPGEQIVDLTEGAGVREQAIEREQLHERRPSMRSAFFVGPDVDVHLHQPKFLATRDFRDTWDSVQDRAADWANSFAALENVQSAATTLDC